jgi:hypothetical protein
MMAEMRNAHRILAQNFFKNIYLGEWKGDWKIALRWI